MKLVDTTSNFCVVEFSPSETSKPIFHNPWLEKEMMEKGIRIPHYRLDCFNGKSVVKLDDPEFPKAFSEIFCKSMLKNLKYEVQA